MKQFLTVMVMSGVVCLLGMHTLPIYAANSNNNSSNGSIKELIDTEKLLFQDLKYYLGVVSAENASAQNLLLYMMPPYNDISQAMGGNILSAEETSQQGQEQYLRAMADYNAYTPQETDDTFLALRLKYCGKAQKGAKNICEYTLPDIGNDVLASSFINTMAYEDDADQNAAYQYIASLTNPEPENYDPKKIYYDPDDLSKGITPDGKKYLVRVFRTMPLLSLAQNSFLALYTERYRLPNSAQDLPIGKDGAASIMEMLKYEATRRYSNADWYDAMNKLSNVGVAREQANINAFQAFMAFKQYEQMSRVEALLAAQVALLVQINSQGAQAEAAAPAVNTEELSNSVTGGS